MSMETRTKRAQAQARYRERLLLGVAVDGDQAVESPTDSAPAPETRVVTQSIVEAVRGLAGDIKRSGVANNPLAHAFQSVLQSAHRRLVDKGYDRDEAQRRLLLYVRGPDPARVDVE